MALTPDEFAEKLRRELTRAGVAAEIEYDKERFALRYPPDGALFLTNAYDEYRRAPFFRRGGVIRRWVLTMKEEREHRLPDTFAEAQGNLLPYVRDLAYFDQIRLMQRTHPAPEVLPFPTQPVGADLVVALAYDSPRSIATLSQKVLDGWGVSLEEALKPARFNLRARTRQGLAQHAPGVFVSPHRDNHDAARILLTELISRLEVKGDPVALIPHRDALIVTGSEDPDGLLQAAALAEPFLKENRRISGAAVVFRNGRWEGFLPAADAPAHEPFRRLRMLALAADYRQQQELLQSLLGEQTFVASYEIIEVEGRWLSYSVWSDGVPTSLPRTDKVFLHSERFAEGDPRRGLKDWAALERAAGALMEKDDVHPARVTVRSFPSEEMLAALSA